MNETFRPDLHRIAKRMVKAGIKASRKEPPRKTGHRPSGNCDPARIGGREPETGNWWSFQTQEIAQNRGCGQRVAPELFVFAGQGDFAQLVLSHVAAEALIDQVNWQVESPPELLGQCTGLAGSRTFSAVHVQGKADDQSVG